MIEVLQALGVILPTAATAAVITNFVQVLTRRWNRADSVADRELTRQAQRDDRVFDAKRMALAEMASAVNEALPHVMTPAPGPFNERHQEIQTRILDAYAAFSLYVDRRTDLVGMKLQQLVIFANADRHVTPLTPEEFTHRASLRMTAFMEKKDLLFDLIRWELGVAPEEQKLPQIRKATRAYAGYRKILEKSSGIEVGLVWDMTTGEPISPSAERGAKAVE